MHHGAKDSLHKNVNPEPYGFRNASRMPEISHKYVTKKKRVDYDDESIVVGRARMALQNAAVRNELHKVKRKAPHHLSRAKPRNHEIKERSYSREADRLLQAAVSHNSIFYTISRAHLLTLSILFGFLGAET